MRSIEPFPRQLGVYVRGVRPAPLGEAAVTLRIPGSKHLALPVLLACGVLACGRVVVDDVPDLLDVRYVLSALERAGATFDWDEPNRRVVFCSGISQPLVDERLTANTRIAVLTLGINLGKFGEAYLHQDLGGCALGSRPIDEHISAFAQMGVLFTESDGTWFARHSSERRSAGGPSVALQKATTMGTLNVLLYMVSSGRGGTLRGAYMRPETLAFVDCLRSLGATVELKAGELHLSNDLRAPLDARRIELLSDHDAAIAYSVAAFLARRKAAIPFRWNQRSPEFEFLERVTGGLIRLTNNVVTIETGQPWPRHPSLTYRAEPFPGLSSDAQPVIVPLLLSLSDEVFVEDTRFPGRYPYMGFLRDSGYGVIESVEGICIRAPSIGADVPSVVREHRTRCTDLRSVMAHILIAIGLNTPLSVDGFQLADRGYVNLVDTMASLGIVLAVSNPACARYAAAIVVDSKGCRYAQSRSPDAARNPGRTSLFGGAVELGEDDEAAIRRELAEEIGLFDFDPTKIGTFWTESTEPGVDRIATVFRTTIAEIPDGWVPLEGVGVMRVRCVRDLRGVMTRFARVTLQADFDEHGDGIDPLPAESPA